MVAEHAHTTPMNTAASSATADAAPTRRVITPPPLAPVVEAPKLPHLRRWGLPLIVSALVFTALTHLMGAPPYIVTGLFVCALAGFYMLHRTVRREERMVSLFSESEVQNRAYAESLSDRIFVAIVLRSVDEPVAGLESGPDLIRRLGPLQRRCAEP